MVESSERGVVPPITADHVRTLLADGGVLIWCCERAVIVPVDGCGRVDGWIVAMPDELDAPPQPEQEWYADTAAELSERCAMRFPQLWDLCTTDVD